LATTAGQKFAALCMPVAAVGLAIATADPSWSPRREHWGSWQATMEREAAAKAKAAAPAPEPVPVPVPVPAPVPAPAPVPGPAPEKPPVADAPKPALPQPEGIEYKVGGLAPARSGVPLKNAEGERLDITVAISGAYRVGTNFADPETVKQSIASASEDLKQRGLLFLVPNLRSPFEALKEVLNAGAGAGWARIGVAVGHPDNIGLGRVLLVTVPVGAGDIPKGMDPMNVKVGTGPSPSFEVNGEACKDAAALEAKVKALHEECELMLEGYTADVEKTPWTIDGTGAMVGGVVSAMDSLVNAGVKQARIVGVRKPAAEGEAPAEPVKEPQPEPKPEPVPEEEKK